MAFFQPYARVNILTMKDFLKENLVIVLAMVLPLALVLTVAVSIYLPSLFLSTNYNFIYAACGDTDYFYYSQCPGSLGYRYYVSDGQLFMRNLPDSDTDVNKNEVPDYQEVTTRLFLHDTQTNESREITFAETQTLKLDDSLISPDGVSVSGQYDRGTGFFLLFDTGSSFNYYLTRGNAESKLNLVNQNGNYYRSNIKFIGWVLSSED